MQFIFLGLPKNPKKHLRHLYEITFPITSIFHQINHDIVNSLPIKNTIHSNTSNYMSTNFILNETKFKKKTKKKKQRTVILELSVAFPCALNS